eukprot:5321449-Ditylum_brightwellii.AAC.1
MLSEVNKMTSSQTLLHHDYNTIPDKVHWLSIPNSLVIVFVHMAMTAAILVCNLYHNFHCYNRLVTTSLPTKVPTKTMATPTKAPV